MQVAVGVDDAEVARAQPCLLYTSDAADVLEFFDACGVLVLEGYGMTESCAAATLNTPSAFRFGTVGRGLPRAQLAIADDGEVLLRGPHVFPRYHRDPDATAATFDGDWLCTGDLGVVDADGYLHITGRKKDLIITSSGKNVTCLLYTSPSPRDS